MRVLFITHFFLPEELSIAYLMKELADALADAGHEVDVLTGFPNWPGGKCFPGYSASQFAHEKMGKLNVYRIPYRAAPNGTFLQRVLDFKSFEFNARRYGRKLPRPDLIYVPVPANEDALAARWLAKHFSCKYVVNVQDIQPDGAIELGYIKNPLAINILRRQERRMYADAAHLVAIGENFRLRLIEKGIPKDKISVMPNWINAEDITAEDRINPLRREWGIPDDKFVVLYAGTFGRIHGTEVLLQTAHLLAAEPRVMFLMVGQGYDFERCREYVIHENLTNVMVKEFVPRTRLSEMQSIANVSIVTLKQGFGHTSVPSKVLGYMSAGRGILALADKDCDTAQLIDAAHCGAVIEPGRADLLTQKIVELLHDPFKVLEWGGNARRYVIDYLDVKVVPRRAAMVLENIANEL